MSGLFPAPPSPVIRRLMWDSDLVTYHDKTIFGDTYPVTWLSEGSTLTAAGDPNYGASFDGFDISKFKGKPPSWTLQQVNPMPDWIGSGGWGPKPTGILADCGVVYLAVQNTLGWRPPTHGRHSQHGSDATILRSIDEGQTWTSPETPGPMFPGARFGGPVFLNHSQDNDKNLDDFLYAVSADQWDNGSEIRLGRVRRDKVQDSTSWEFLSTGQSELPHWSRWLNDAAPILTSPRTLSCPDFVYLAALDRYLILTWYFHKEFDPLSGSDLLIFDSPTPWGPYTLSHFEREWWTPRVGPYCPRLPLAWLDDDGLGGWILASGNFTVQNDAARTFYRPNAMHFRWDIR